MTLIQKIFRKEVANKILIKRYNYFDAFKINDFREYALLALVFFLPINQRISTLLIIFNFILVFFQFNKIKIKKSLIPFVLIYALYVIYPNDLLDNIEQKAAFLAFPIIFIGFDIKHSLFKKIFIFFVYGCLTNYSISILYGIWHSIDFINFKVNPILKQYRLESKDLITSHILHTTYFLGKQMANSMHASYLSIYYVFSLYIVYVYRFILNKKLILTSLVLVLGVFQIFTIIGILLLILLLFKIIYDYSKKYFVIVIGIIGLSFLLLNLNTQQKKPLLDLITSKIDVTRPIIWTTAANLIKEEPFLGYGVKNSQKQLEKNYPVRGNLGSVFQGYKLNCHNQYLQITLEIGLIGFLLLLIIYCLYFKQLAKFKDQYIKNILIGFLIIVSLFFSVESVLNRYAGLSFFLLFISLVIFCTKPDKLEN